VAKRNNTGLAGAENPAFSHGYALRGVRSPTYDSWCHMKQRCYNKDWVRYDRYGGRGVTVCDRWRDSFINFVADMGDRPSGGTLDRIDNDGNYEPGNCRWATRRQQAENRHNAKRITHDGYTMSVIDWAKKLGIKATTIRARLKRRLSAELVLSTSSLRQ